MDNSKIKKLEANLWTSADTLRSNSKLTSNEYCMPVLGLIFLRYAYSRYKKVEAEIKASLPKRNGVTREIDASDFTSKSAIFLPPEAQYEFVCNAKPNETEIKDIDGNPMKSRAEMVNNAMNLIEKEKPELAGILPKDYNKFSDKLLDELLRIFNNGDIDEVGGDIIGRIYEYFLNKFAKNVASDDGVFFTPKSLVKMIVNIIEPQNGIVLDPACGSGGMFVQTGDFVEKAGGNAVNSFTFYGQEKVAYNAQLCKMNMAVHGLPGKVKSGDEANTFYHDAHNLAGKCDYVMANPPFNVDMVEKETCEKAGRLPFGLPASNPKTKCFGNANYLWISYFHAYLNEKGRAGFVMASSATDSSNKDRDIREKLVLTGDVDVMVSVGNNFFYTLSLPCSLWFFNKGKSEELKDKVLFIDARNYYTVVDRTLNEWTDWQLKNLNAIVWLYRGEIEKYKRLVADYWSAVETYNTDHADLVKDLKKPSVDTSDRFPQALSLFDNVALALKEQIKALQAELKDTKTKKTKEEKNKLKTAIAEAETSLKETDEAVQMAKEAIWLTEKFGFEGNYQDVAGLCKIATRAEIAEKNYSLTPGAYVGVTETKDDGVDFYERMNEIHAELARLNTEANALMNEIQKSWEGIK